MEKIWKFGQEKQESQKNFGNLGKKWRLGKNVNLEKCGNLEKKLEIWEKFEILKKFGNLENIQIFGNGFDSIENLEII